MMIVEQCVKGKVIQRLVLQDRMDCFAIVNKIKEIKMKKNIFVFLFAFVFFATLQAATMTSARIYDEAVAYCEEKGMHLATIDELKTWAGSDDQFWSLEGKTVRPRSGRIGFDGRNRKDLKYLVRCEGETNATPAFPSQPVQ